MPLPSGWEGCFYDQNTCGDEIFDLSIDEFMVLCEHASQRQPNSQKFYIAGAIADCIYNGQSEKAGELIAAAKAKWNQKEGIWDKIGEIVESAKKEFADCEPMARKMIFVLIEVSDSEGVL